MNNEVEPESAALRTMEDRAPRGHAIYTHTLTHLTHTRELEKYRTHGGYTRRKGSVGL